MKGKTLSTTGEILNQTVDSAGGYLRNCARLTNSQTLTGSNATVATAIFGVTGSVMILRLWAEVTTVLGSNHTAAAYRLNDQTAQVDITAVGGTTLSSAGVGALIVKKGLAAAAITLLTPAAGRVSEPTTLETDFFSPFVAVKKTAAATNIEYVYATTQTPTTGVLKHYVDYIPLSSDGALTAL